ncbi:hypothetical protein LTR56_017032 [Elasticomyces elasticus]|nr:hypothetical protein LTR22_021624 [Elasticomyces elasticus]KAK3631131.1 hypothetical protein LTR56_017032 [Elasticomyces elasticus]KAK4912643.1 hypothetical protein LTR49_018912 [Elasticomyces elasticus]KAK5752134.1 hypothetical protein LTS12_017813 [Elasticomyces elasticus]
MDPVESKIEEQPQPASDTSRGAEAAESKDAAASGATEDIPAKPVKPKTSKLKYKSSKPKKGAEVDVSSTESSTDDDSDSESSEDEKPSKQHKSSKKATKHNKRENIPSDSEESGNDESKVKHSKKTLVKKSTAKDSDDSDSSCCGAADIVVKSKKTNKRSRTAKEKSRRPAKPTSESMSCGTKIRTEPRLFLARKTTTTSTGSTHSWFAGPFRGRMSTSRRSSTSSPRLSVALYQRFCEALVKYVDKDFKDAKKRIYPLLESGSIEFDLLWALFKPNDIVVFSTYGVWDEPRCFRVSSVTQCETKKRGKWYSVEGRYLEYDGKEFGWAELEIEIKQFKGPRAIASLSIYPLKYHKDRDSVMDKIITRGKRFIALDRMQYKYHHGIAFYKDPKKGVARFNVNGRIMIDSATFRRINPNYPFRTLNEPMGDDVHSDDDSDEGYSSITSIEACSTGESSSDDDAKQRREARRRRYIHIRDQDGELHRFKCRTRSSPEEDHDQPIDPIASHALPGQPGHSFADDDLLLTSPVLLGFSFADKLWLELSISGVHDIEFDEGAFESLMLPEKQKNIVRALVESHKFNAAKGIDDVIRGKGKGLVSVLHGPPGTGKTLTAESISELLRCPLYSVSAGELGTDSAKLEVKLNEILDIASTWGAVLLLDEADVFLERREAHDISRNALVSIFLRMLEYFQGILFLTTNRVDTFDEAFQSRIHLPLRYQELSTAAKKAVWKLFLEAVRKADSDLAVDRFTEEGLDDLSRRQLNGRQIKNAVRTAQAIALREGSKLNMEHIKKVLSVSEEFERDLKGGTGYTEAMRSYT